jgi:hypothetical protein
MDELTIIKHLAQRIDSVKYPYQAARVFIYDWECDYWAMTDGGETREFEIKISRSDYLKDKQKDKHKRLNGANYFYYVCPTGLIKKEEVDSKYGLMYVSGEGKISIEKKPRQLNYNVFNNWKLLANKFYWRFRELWREKYIDKVITRDEYFEGFNISLSDFEPAQSTNQ